MWSGQTGPDGSFAPTSLPAEAVVHISITADGYVQLERTDALHRLLDLPLRLEEAPLICVRALSASAASVITEYGVTLIRRRRSAESASWETGSSRRVKSADGVGCVPTPWAPPWTLRLRAKGFATTDAVVHEYGTHELRLADEALLRLTIEDPDGHPVAGAQAALVEPELESPRGFVTSADWVRQSDEEGRIAWEGLEPGEYRLHVSHPEYLPETRVVRLVSAPSSEVSVRLRVGVRVTVRVLSRDSPVANASVALDARNVQTSTALGCVTGSDGRCTIAGVPPGSFDITASGPALARVRQRVIVQDDRRAMEIDLRLPTGIRLTGTVANTERYPGLSFEVAVSTPGAALRTAPVVGTDFAVEDVARGRVSVWIRRAGSASSYAFEETTVAAEAPTAHVYLELPVPSWLHGTVVSEGRPCGACPIIATRLGGEVGVPSVSTSTDLTGRYEMVLPAPRATYAVRIDDLSSGRSFVEQIEVAGDVERDFVFGELVLPGTVVWDRSGTAAPGAAVQVYGDTGLRVAEAQADSAGQFRIAGLRQGRHTVSASLSGSTGTAVVDVVAGMPPVSIALDASQPLWLRLIDAEAGGIVPTTAVLVEAADGSRLTHNVLAAETDGNLAVPISGPGPYSLVVKARGYAYRTIHGLVAGAPVQVPLVPAGRSFIVQAVEGIDPCWFSLVDRMGRPVGLTILFPIGAVPLVTRKALFNEIEPGEYVAVLTTCDQQRFTEEVGLRPGHVPTVIFGTR